MAGPDRGYRRRQRLFRAARSGPFRDLHRPRRDLAGHLRNHRKYSRPDTCGRAAGVGIDSGYRLVAVVPAVARRNLVSSPRCVWLFRQPRGSRLFRRLRPGHLLRRRKLWLCGGGLFRGRAGFLRAGDFTAGHAGPAHDRMGRPFLAHAPHQLYRPLRIRPRHDRGRRPCFRSV